MREPIPSAALAMRVAAACASGAAYAAAQPGLGAWPLAFVCLVPLLLACRGAPLGQRVLLGWLAGSVATAIATLDAGSAGASSYFGLSRPAALAVALAVGQLFGAGSFALSALLAGDPARGSPLAAASRLAAAWAVAELARCTLFTGFPWLLLAYALLPVPELAQLASLAGAVGVSAALAFVNAGFAGLLAPGEATRQRAAAGLAALAAVALVASCEGARGAGGGGVEVAADGRGEAALRVLLVQHAPPVARRSAPVDVVPALERLRALTRSEPDFDLAVWSENALPALLPENAHLLRGALPEGGAPRALLLGAARADPARPGALHTSAFLADASGELLGPHDKVRLLPFAERAPWPLSASQLGIVPITPGAEPRVLTWRGIGFGPLLCYEVLFAGLARQLARSGAGILVNLSNDTWFGSSGAAEQHLAAAMYRAIETRRPLLRATHGGISAGLDASGRVVARLPRDVPGTLALDVEPGAGVTPYARLGDAPLFALAVAILLAGALRPHASSARPSPSNAPVPGSGIGTTTVSSNISASRPKSWPRNTTRTMPSSRSMPRKLSIQSSMCTAPTVADSSSTSPAP